MTECVLQNDDHGNIWNSIVGGWIRWMAARWKESVAMGISKRLSLLREMRTEKGTDLRSSGGTPTSTGFHHFKEIGPKTRRTLGWLDPEVVLRSEFGVCYCTAVALEVAVVLLFNGLCYPLPLLLSWREGSPVHSPTSNHGRWRREFPCGDGHRSQRWRKEIWGTQDNRSPPSGEGATKIPEDQVPHHTTA